MSGTAWRIVTMIFIVESVGCWYMGVHENEIENEGGGVRRWPATGIAIGVGGPACLAAPACGERDDLMVDVGMLTVAFILQRAACFIVGCCRYWYCYQSIIDNDRPSTE